MSRRRRTVDYPWMKRQATDYPQEMRVVWTCDRCGRERDRSEFFEFYEYELSQFRWASYPWAQGLESLKDDRLGLYFVCKEGCHAATV